MGTARVDGDLPASTLLRALLLEDSPRDAKLMVARLESAGYLVQFEVMDSLESFRLSLEKAEYDVILADFNLRNWTALDALEIRKRSGKDIPLIVVTGSLGDESAVECIKQGAADFVLKDRPARLPAAVRRALEERRLREERQQAEAERARLVTAIEQSAEGVVITNTAGDIEYVNPAFTRMTGYSREEVIGRNPRILKSEKQDPAFYQELWATILQGQIWRGEIVNQRKDGKVYTEEMNIAPVRGARGEITHFIATKEDVTERKNLENQFRQAQKLEAVGRLAAGVAHDFNNLLTVIMGYCRLAVEVIGGAEPPRRYLEEVLAAAERAASLTRQLLAFSRQQTLQPTILNLNHVIAAMEMMLRRLIGECIELVFVPDPAIGLVKADAGQIEQVVMNLAVNSSDAMPQGGKLTIKTTNVELDEDYAGSHVSIQPGSYVMLAVSDTGSGMDAETRAKIFEPFFTTKEKGKGTGLGLSTVYGIVKQSGGYIWVYSEPNRGTTFKVYLPRVPDVAADVKPSGPAPRLLKGSETVLVVEDEEAVRSLVRATLEAYGYQVLIATRGDEALSISASHSDPIDLMLTDVVLPGMSGRELVERMESLRPEMRILYMSGYTGSAVVRHHLLDPGVHFIQKPFQPESLARKVREALEGIPNANG